MKELIDTLNHHTKLYDAGKPEISDYEWDNLYFKLVDMERKTGVIYPESPTQKINYEVKSALEKVEHNHPMLSLEKTKDINELKSFIGDRVGDLSLKLDGLSCSLSYRGGRLVSAQTRGNGVIGEDITHNALVMGSIPKTIPIKEDYDIDGEIISKRVDFERFKDEYKNQRNFAAGSIRLLDSRESQKRHLSFYAWNVINGSGEKNWSGRMAEARDMGFSTVCSILFDGSFEGMESLQNKINLLRGVAETQGIPIDGVILRFSDIEYGKSLGQTAHHPNDAIAFKFYDEEAETKLIDIEWSMGRFGALTPIAIFDPIDLEGTTVSRASLHNIDIMNQTLSLPKAGQTIYVVKSNQIIPQIVRADEDGDGNLTPPTHCPYCKEKLNYISPELVCTNLNCEAKLINKLDHFCSKKGLDIKGLSKATLEKLVDWGWVNSKLDILKLKDHRAEWVTKSGFGVASVDKILNSIEAAKHTTFEKFLSSLGISLIGQTVSKELHKHFKDYADLRRAIDNNHDFTTIATFGPEKQKALYAFNYAESDMMYPLLHFAEEQVAETNSVKPESVSNKIFCITGKLTHFKNRDELKAKIESLGGKVSSSVTTKTSYLINNDKLSTSAKNKDAISKGVPIISEEDFLKMIKE